MNPYVMLAAVIFWAASVGGAGWFGIGVGKDQEVSKRAAVDQAVIDTREAAQQGTAAALAAMKPINTTIVQRTEHEIRQNTVYADCVLPAGGLSLANQAITGRVPAEPAGGGGVP